MEHGPLDILQNHHHPHPSARNRGLTTWDHGGKTLLLAGGAERKDALSQEPNFLNEIKIAFVFINLLLQLQSTGAAPGTFTGSSAHQLLWQWVTASGHSLSCRSLCPTPGDKWRPMVSTAQQGRRATVLQT